MSAGQDLVSENTPFLSASEYDYITKILLVGESGVGKTSMVLKFADNVFQESFISTIGVDFRFVPIKLQLHGTEKTVKLQIWDTAGQERFRAVTMSFYRGAHAVMLCFDLTDRLSFMKVREWLSDITKYMDMENGTVILVGTKSDLVNQRQVSYETAKQYADEKGYAYIETSSKTGSGVKEAFSLIASQSVNKRILKGEKEHRPQPMPTPRNNSCCVII